MEKTLVIADSRGAGMSILLDEYNDIGRTVVLTHRGAGYIRAAMDSLETIRSFKPTMIVLLAGICDVTARNRNTKITTVRSTDPILLLENVSAALSRALDIIIAATNARVSVATVTGLDLKKYNNFSKTTNDNQQETINNLIVSLNRKIIDINKDNNVPTTWTASRVHPYYRGKYHHLYNRLSDGCHPNNETKRYWARMIAKAIRLTKPRK